MPRDVANSDPTMENLIVGLIALALFVFLLAAMLSPEKF